MKYLWKPLGWIGWATTFVLVAFWSGLVGTWVADRNTPIKFKSLKPLTAEVFAGDYVKMQYEIIRLEHCFLRIERRIIDSKRILHILPSIEGFTRGSLGYDTFVAVLRVPNSVSAGTATYQPTFIYECNPIHKIWPIVLHVPNMTFTVRQ